MDVIATRREKVELTLDDQLTPGLIRAAAAAKLLDRELDGVGGSQTRVGVASDKAAVSTSRSARSMDELESRARRAERSSSLLVDSIIGLGPALLPIGALAVPAIAGLSAGLGFAAAGAGVALLAFNDMGAALKAVDQAQLEPTTANLEKMNLALEKLGPAGREFVGQLDALEPQLKSLKNVAEAGLLPGVSEGIDSLLDRLPQVRSIVAEVATTLGDLTAEAGAGLASDRFTPFFDYLESDAKPILMDMGQTLGNVTAGFANLFVAFAPQEQQFSNFLLTASRNFSDFADGLGETDGFTEFVDFLAENGPKVANALGAIGGAIASVAKAGAPLSGPVLDGIAALARLVERIADSDLGTPLVTMAAGLALVNRALAVSAAAKGSLLTELLLGAPGAGGSRGATAIDRTRSSVRGLVSDVRTAGRIQILPSAAELEKTAAATGRVKTSLAGVAKGGAALGALAIASTGAADGLGLTNTATLGLAGSLLGPLGAGVGAGAGALLDLKAAGKGVAETLDDVHKAAAQGDYDRLAKSLGNLKKQNEDLNNISSIGDAFSDTGKKLGSLLNGNNFMNDSSEAFFGGIQLALLQVKQEIPGAKTSLDLLNSGFMLTADGADAAGGSVDAFARQVALANNVLAGRASMVNYQAALDDFSKSLKENKKALADQGRSLMKNGRIDISIPEGRAVRSALDNIANSALKVSETLQGADRIKFLQGARKDFIQAARDAGIPRRAARLLADSLGLLDLIHAKPKVTLVDQATGKISGIKGKLEALDGTHAKTYVDNYVNQHGSGGGTAHADGGYISGPGGDRDDLIPARLSNGEYVVKAAAVRQYGSSMLDDINAQRFANGGMVGSDFVTGYNAAQDAQQIAGVISQIASITRDLSKKGKRGLKGPARDSAIADLAAANAELAYLRNKSYFDQLAIDDQTAKDNADAAIQAAQDRENALQSTRDSLFGSFDLFSRGTSAASAERYAANFLQDVGAYSSSLQLLVAAGAGAGVLKNVERVAESGDYKSAAKLARNLASNPAALGNVNSAISQAQTIQSGIASIVNGAAFAATNAGTASSNGPTVVVPISPDADPNLWLADLRRTVVHTVQDVLAQQAMN